MPRLIATIAQYVALLEKHPEGLSYVEVAKALGVAESTAYKALGHARQAGLVRSVTTQGLKSLRWHAGTQATEGQRESVVRSVLAMAARPGGVLVSDVQGCSRSYASKLVKSMTEAGQLVKVMEGCARVFFTSQEGADAWVRGAGRLSRRVLTAKPKHTGARPGWGATPAVPAEPKPQQPAPAAERLVKTFNCPSRSYDPRYQLPPGERVLGGFATLGIGRYLEAEAA